MKPICFMRQVYALAMRSHTRARPSLLASLLFLCAGLARAALPDGPYVLPGANGWEAHAIDVTNGEARAQVRPLAAHATLTVPGVGAVPPFTVRLRGPAAEAPGEIHTPKGVPLFVVADTHGEYEILVAMLRAHQVIGRDLAWTFARGHLVVLGDVFDRGPNHLEILWLLYELEDQARRAGGGVHLLLGNHEIMALQGDARYLNARYADSARLLGKARYADLFAPNTLLGQWLRSKPALLKVDDYLCLHAGISRALIDSRLTLGEINAAVRSVLNGEPGQGAIAELVLGPLGPLWYRGYFAAQRDFPPASAEDVELTLATFGAKRILIGHTRVSTITPLYDGKVIAVQVYPERDDTGHVSFQSLLIRKGQLWNADVDGSLRRLAPLPALAR
jgi:hypothetical protein